MEDGQSSVYGKIITEKEGMCKKCLKILNHHLEKRDGKQLWQKQE